MRVGWWYWHEYPRCTAPQFAASWSMWFCCGRLSCTMSSWWRWCPEDKKSKAEACDLVVLHLHRLAPPTVNSYDVPERSNKNMKQVVLLWLAVLRHELLTVMLLWDTQWNTLNRKSVVLLLQIILHNEQLNEFLMNTAHSWALSAD